jgi:hypothetical protein
MCCLSVIGVDNGEFQVDDCILDFIFCTVYCDHFTALGALVEFN